MNKGGQIVSGRDYYPLGEVIRESINSDNNVRYKYTSEERDSDTNLDYFGARFYDSEIGRWLSVDPMTEKYSVWSPYNYCLGNPLRFIDPDGMEIRVNSGEIDEEGEIIYHYVSSMQKRQMVVLTKTQKYLMLIIEIYFYHKC